MAYEIDPQKFGEMAANVNTLLIHQSEIRSALARQQDAIRGELENTTEILFKKIDSLRIAVEELRVNGCAIGRQHSADIKTLQEVPSRLVAIGSMIIAALAAVGGGAIWLHQKLLGNG